MNNVTIYHNPLCGTSRKTLELLRNAGIEPTVIEYLKEPYTRERFIQLLQQMATTPRALLRNKETLYESLDLSRADLTDETLIDVMIANPILINRPIVVTPLGARLCRPAEMVLEIVQKK